MNYDIFILLIVGIALTYGGLALYLNLSEVLGAFLAGMIIAEARRNFRRMRNSLVSAGTQNNEYDIWKNETKEKSKASRVIFFKCNQFHNTYYRHCHH
jgi:divalent metal cation (Fe/Co/Zn/Cd) transporter